MQKNLLFVLSTSICLGFCCFLIFPNYAHAYIGPGAVFAFLGSTFVFVLTAVMAIVTFSFWPIQILYRKLRGYGISKNARTRRVVILGLDGLEPTLVEKYMEQGMLPNMKALKESGSYRRLGTTLPALSPVAWSSFQTGVNPGAHNIFDFLTRDKRFCMPELSSTAIEKRPGWKLGPISLTAPKTSVRISRKSKPFWHILSKKGIFANILRVPISYPPEPFDGNILSAMCTPDLRGTQGTFSFFTNKKTDSEQKISGEETGGEIRSFKKLSANRYQGSLIGPPDPKIKNSSLSLDFELETRGQIAILKIANQAVTLELNKTSQWITVEFFYSRTKSVKGVARFCLRGIGEDVALYVSPINIHPEEPALPISHPIFFSRWLAKKNGLYGTLGLMEDTWGRNELALDDANFLEQAYSTHAEREQMFFDLLERTKEGLCACVFDASDRIQHMFWRYLDEKHPSPLESKEKFADTIPQMYQKMDQLVGKVQAKLNKQDTLFVLSDHGFASFRRGINLNTWLLQNGYLHLKEGVISCDDYLQGVDWTKTRAFAIGLSGLYINRKGREVNGIVSEQEAVLLKEEISKKLSAIKDPQDQSPAINKVFDSTKAYRGLYTEEAPDLIVGYNRGYRVSWQSVTGGIEAQVFSDNVKAWSGDHHVDPELVPGILFSNLALTSETPKIIDLAPTVLDLFAVPVPKYMEGNVIA